MVKKAKNIKQNPRELQQTELLKKKANVSDAFLDELQGAFTKFDKITESKRIELYGDQKYLDQFWKYFTNEYPNLLDKIDKKDLPVYIQALEHKGFKLSRLVDEDDSKKLHAEFSSEDTEEHVIKKSLEDFKTFCEDNINNVPSDAYNKFASAAGFDSNTFQLDPDGKCKTIDDILVVRKKFLEKEGITLGKTSAEHAERILSPLYNPTERVMVTVAISKIRKTFTGALKTAFDTQFKLPITIFSPYQDLFSFKNERTQFLIDHETEIDESLAKKLDAIIVTNGDIKNELFKTGRMFDESAGFSEWEQYYRTIFNKLATRQLFEELKKSEESVDQYINAMGNTFKEFPPYVNEILKIYPFNDREIVVVDASFHSDVDQIDNEILALQEQHAAAATEKERKELRKNIKELKQQREQRRWEAYIAFLRSKNVALADVFAALVQSTFDFSVLTVEQQQLLIDILMKHKLEDTIKHKIPELLSVTEEDLTQFINDLFDLQKMDITIPTRLGPVPLKFLKKEFMGTMRKELPGVNDLEQLKNLPLNFLTQITESNASFFEETPIFDSLFTDFSARNGTFALNDAYKVRIKKGDKVAEGYLSPYSLLDERNTEESDGKELYLYSEPITSPNQERTLVSWTDVDGKNSGVPVVILNDQEQQDCDLEILDKQLNFNGEALGALLFGYVLGQESLQADLPPKKEKEFAEKLGKLDIYREQQEEQEEESETSEVSDEDKIEHSEYETFMKEWENIAGYNFPEEHYKENHGFVEGTRLFIPFFESSVPPTPHTGNNMAWMDMHIININKDKGTFTVKLLGGETKLGAHEGIEKTLPIKSTSLDFIKECFGNTMYKMPDVSAHGFDDRVSLLQSTKAAEGLADPFGKVKLEGGKFKFVTGDAAGENVEYFGWYEQQIVEDPDKEQGVWALFKVNHHSNNTFTLKADFVDDKGQKVVYERTMDYPSFLLFINEKKLQPKSKAQATAMKKNQETKDQETPTTKKAFGIAHIFGFFKNSFGKLKDALKKHDEEKTEDLTDLLTSQGQLYGKIGKLFSPFGKISSSFENMGVEYFSDRDSRLRKKVEKRKKFYEDADFSLLYTNHIGPMLTGGIVPKPHYKAAAMLLAMIAKGKGPYNRNPEFAAKGMRVNILMGPAHQQRYLDMRQKLIRELEQGSSQYGSIWTDHKKNEILELEMKYIVHVMDGRQLGIQDGDKTKYYFYGKYSKQFIDELEGGYNKFFSQSMVEEGFGKLKNSSFDFARAEFFRLLGDRPQQAIPFLKVMATKAVSDNQRKTFEMAVMAGMLSGVFLTMTMSDTQGMIKNICRTRGFVPGIWVKNINQQTKLQRMLDIFSGGKFSSMKFGPKGKEKTYQSGKFSFNDISGGTKDFVKGFETWVKQGNTLDQLSKFFALTGSDQTGQKTLLDIYANPKTSVADKILIKEFIDNSNEKNEGLDNDVRNNPYALKGSILTKSQSAVHQMLKVDQTGFAGKDGDEIQTMKGFFTDMTNTIPKTKIDGKQQVAFFLDKFFNRFDEKGFSGNNVSMFLKRLKRCKQHPGHKELDRILYYSVVGPILESLGRGTLPVELENALVARKDFFKSNLDTILQSDVITDHFGGLAFKQDYDRYEPKLEPREHCVNILDRDLKQTFLYGLPKEEKQRWAQKERELRSENYLNKPLYELAEKLERNFSKRNLFKNSVDDVLVKKPFSKETSSTKVTGAKIKNSDVADKVKRILEGKPLDEDVSDDYIPLMEEYEYSD